MGPLGIYFIKDVIRFFLYLYDQCEKMSNSAGLLTKLSKEDIMRHIHDFSDCFWCLNNNYLFIYDTFNGKQWCVVNRKYETIIYGNNFILIDTENGDSYRVKNDL